MIGIIVNYVYFDEYIYLKVLGKIDSFILFGKNMKEKMHLKIWMHKQNLNIFVSMCSKDLSQCEM
jgi:hypothetical protein